LGPMKPWAKINRLRDKRGDHKNARSLDLVRSRHRGHFLYRRSARADNFFSVFESGVTAPAAMAGTVKWGDFPPKQRSGTTRSAAPIGGKQPLPSFALKMNTVFPDPI